MHSPETIRDMAGLQPTTSRCADPSKAPPAQPTAPRHAALAPSGNFNPSPDPKPRTRAALQAIGPDGLAFTVKGQTAKALRALVEAGVTGVTALEVTTWALRLAAYVHDLRKRHGLTIETLREGHEGGWHGRYVLRAAVRLVEGGQ